MTQVILPHRYAAQLTGYTCGPAATKHVLSTAGRNDLTEAGLAREMGTTVNGTDDINSIRPVLAKYTGRGWDRHGIPNDPPTRAQEDLLRRTILQTVVQERRGMVVNIWAPPSNNLPGYPNYLVMHYIAVVGYNTATGMVYLADSARFGGHEHYWVSVPKLASLIPPKAWAALANVTDKPAPDPAPPASSARIGNYKGAPVSRSGAGSNAAPPTRQAIIVHDTEGGYEGAISWMMSQRNGSYHIIRALAGQGARLVPDSRQAWGAMATGNRIGLHISIEGYARWSRAEWLSKGRDGLEGMAHDIAAWAKQYGIPLTRISGADLRAGKRGVATHADVSTAWRETNHTDPGAGFPIDLVIARARDLNTPTNGGFLMALSDAEQKELLSKTRYIADQLGPGFDSWGEDGDLGKNARGQRLTLRAGLAKLLRGAE